jgi:hypothetical protein
MNRDQARKIGPVIVAFGDGEEIQCCPNVDSSSWVTVVSFNLEFHQFQNWRIHRVGRWRLFARRIWIAVHELCAP